MPSNKSTQAANKTYIPWEVLKVQDSSKFKVWSLKRKLLAIDLFCRLQLGNAFCVKIEVGDSLSWFVGQVGKKVVLKVFIEFLEAFVKPNSWRSKANNRKKDQRPLFVVLQKSK